MGSIVLDALKQVVKLILLPPAGLLVLALIGLAIARRRPRAGWALAMIAVASLTLLSIPAVGALLVRCLDQSPPLDLARARSAQAIVVLGGGTRLHAPEYGAATIGAITLERVRYGARVARATGLPVLVSGGPVRGAPPEAVLMRNVLTQEFGVPVRWIETDSRNTHENAVNSAALLKAAGVHKIVLIGHAFDFPRSRAEFAAAGIESIPAPIDVPPETPGALSDLIPSTYGIQLSRYVLYEMLANALRILERQPAPPAT
jgi:uncharacterized SAM-binding protein YcdF (DUF218 family)